jgi:hypothetical protein
MQRNIPIIPVLIDYAAMPKPSDLPDAIKGFCYLNAARVCDGADFYVHIDRLIRNINTILGNTVSKPVPVLELVHWLNSVAEQLVTFLSKSDPPLLASVGGRSL